MGRRRRRLLPIPSSPRGRGLVEPYRPLGPLPPPSSTGSSPAWSPPCRGRPSGRRGRTRRAIMRACGLCPARRWAPSACSCAGATSPPCRDAWWPGRCSRRAPRVPSSTGSPGPPCPCAPGSLDWDNTMDTENRLVNGSGADSRHAIFDARYDSSSPDPTLSIPTSRSNPPL